MLTLLLVPTARELTRLEALGLGSKTGGSQWVGTTRVGVVRAELIGVGPIAAAARAAALFERARQRHPDLPLRAVLVGIAGSYRAKPRHPAECFGSVRLDGVGAGSGARHLLPSAMGLPQWTDGEGDVFEELPLAIDGPALLTVAAAAADPADVAERRARHPKALGEDMEAFGVALAARLAKVPLAVIRGWSNVAGERDPSRWDIDGALEAAREIAAQLVYAPWDGEDEDDVDDVDDEEDDDDVDDDEFGFEP